MSCEKLDSQILVSILRTNLADDCLEVIDYTLSNLVPLGENFGSNIVKLDVTIKRKYNKTEKLHLVAKMMGSGDGPFASWRDLVKREVFVFSKLIPAYRKLENEMGLEPEKLIDLLPKYYGHYTSSHDEFDDDSLFLMENMKLKGYYMADKNIGLDLDHARLTIGALARYHALGIVLKTKEPELFAEAVARTKSVGINEKQFDEMYLGVLETFRESKQFFENHFDAIESSFSEILKNGRSAVASEEPWMTITHGDFWVNNLLFHKDELNGKVDDVKFIDFQVYLYNSPLKDFVLFLCGSVEDKTLMDHLDKLVDAYYTKFTSTLDAMRCNSEGAFTRLAFDRELKKVAVREFPSCAMARKFFAFEVKDAETSTELLNNFNYGKCTSAMIKKYQVLVDVYDKKGWF